MRLNTLLPRSLRARATVFTWLILVLGMSALSMYVSHSLQTDMQRLLGEQQQSVVTALAKNMQDDLTQRLRALDAIASQMDAPLLRNPAALQHQLENRALLQLLFNGGVWVADATGTAIADVPRSSQRIGTNFSHQDYMAATLASGKWTVGRPLMDEQLKTPMVALSVPVRDVAGKVIGAVVGVTHLQTDSFLDIHMQGSYGKTGGFLLIAPQHQLVVTATDTRRNLQPAPAPGVNAMHDRYMLGFEGFGLAVSSRGVLELSAAKGIPAAGWFVVATLPASEAFAPLHDLQQRLLWATLLFTALTAGLTWWVLKRQLDPLVDTANAMRALADSRATPQPLVHHRDDEIGQLTNGFNRILQTWHQREAALTDSQESLAITLNSIGDGVIATDTQGHITRMNPTAERLTGWPLAEAMGKPLSDVFALLHTRTHLPVPNPVQRVIERNDVVSMDTHTTLLARNQRTYQIADSAAPIRDGTGQIVGVVLVFSDVTERYRAEAAVQHIRAMMERTEATAHLASFQWDAQTDVVTWSPEMFHIFGLDPALGTPNLEGQAKLYTPASTQLLYGAVARALADKLPYELELLAVLPDGEQRPCRVMGFPECDDGGRVVAISGLVQDITLQKQEEKATRLAACVFSHAREGITITDAEGTIVDVNEAFTRITGYDRDSALGRNPRFLQSGRQDKAFYEAMWQDLTGPGHWSGEVWNRRKNGEVYAELLTISAVRDANGVTQQYVALFSDITGIKAHQNQLERIAHFDALTNLPNRVLLADRLNQAVAQTPRRNTTLTVAFLDLDGFKAINDRHGHDMGDQLLVALAARMKQCLREGDTLGRLGGDEFVAVLTDLPDPQASTPLLTRLLDAAAQPVIVGDTVLQVSASLGVTFFPQTEAVEPDQLLRQADQAMYQAKVAGKNRYHVFDPAQDSSIRGHHDSLQRIRLALDRHEFVLHYQPKVNMRTGQVIGAEALIRWLHPEDGLLAPATFLPVIEDHPLAVTLGEWVIEAALAQLDTWLAAGFDLPVSINIGARQLQQANFTQRLQTFLNRYPRVHPGCLELEVLETSALQDMVQVAQTIEACAQMGVRFALDDFGTGYSSLTYLKRLHVAILKIDQSFVRDMLEDPDDLAILQGVIDLSAAFKREVIAEGVETAAHGNALLQLGCEQAQGYGIARPMPPDLIVAWA
ncbi:MAG: EAL domain-containing protein, partial [Burkholderiales bacterium]|nr:EAL domain-containing protein [Burkholderiales bacterium]